MIMAESIVLQIFAKPEIRYVCSACLEPKNYSNFYSNHAETKQFPKCKECTILKKPQLRRECRACKSIKSTKDFTPHINDCKECVAGKVRVIEKSKITEKTCTKCKTLKPIKKFPDNKNCLDRKGSWCYDCSLSHVAEGSELWIRIMA